MGEGYTVRVDERLEGDVWLRDVYVIEGIDYVEAHMLADRQIMWSSIHVNYDMVKAELKRKGNGYTSYKILWKDRESGEKHETYHRVWD